MTAKWYDNDDPDDPTTTKALLDEAGLPSDEIMVDQIERMAHATGKSRAATIQSAATIIAAYAEPIPPKRWEHHDTGGAIAPNGLAWPTRLAIGFAVCFILWCCVAFLWLLIEVFG